MTLLELAASIAALGLLLVLPITELLKRVFNLKDVAVLMTSTAVGAALGVVLASGGLPEMAGLGAFPHWASGLVVGVLAGLTASGGKDTLTNLQAKGAQARAEALVRAQSQGAPTEAGPLAAPVSFAPMPPPVPAPAPPAAPDEWAPATLDRLTPGETP